jgi:hypothetical protein
MKGAVNLWPELPFGMTGRILLAAFPAMQLGNIGQQDVLEASANRVSAEITRFLPKCLAIESLISLAQQHVGSNIAAGDQRRHADT